MDALYAFVRVADDVADEPEHGSARVERLQEWRRRLADIGKEEPKHPVFVALAGTISELGLPKELFDELLCAFIEDCGKSRCETSAELLEHCRRCAAPVGRLTLMIHGCRDEELFRLSDKLCTGLRMASFLGNVAADLKKDRLYFPQEDLRACGYTEADLRMGLVNERFRNLLKMNWKRTRALFEEGRPLSGRLAWPLCWEVRWTWFCGMELLRKVRKQGFDTLRRRPDLGMLDIAPLLFKTLTRR
jgi:squalene synthase HpnC